MGDIVSGTVIQRSFVGRKVTNVIHVATIPIAELGVESEEVSEDIVAEVLSNGCAITRKEHF
jgi:hypothetical protein